MKNGLVPYLQLDVPGRHDEALKRRLASAIGACYAEAMQTGRHIPAVVVRDCADGGPWRWEDGELREVAVLMCDIRRGRDRARREAAARRLAELVATELGLPHARVVVEFTQHEASEMYRYGALAPEWTPDEA